MSRLSPRIMLMALLVASSTLVTFANTSDIRHKLSSIMKDGLLQINLDMKDLLQPTEVTNKRTSIDFGLGRGYSGSQAARHMLGLQQASFSGGPGKKKRVSSNWKPSKYLNTI